METVAKQRWFKAKFWFYGAIVVGFPSREYFQVGSRTQIKCGLTEDVLKGSDYVEISEDEALRWIAREDRRGRRWHEGVTKFLEVCGRLTVR